MSNDLFDQSHQSDQEPEDYQNVVSKYLKEDGTVDLEAVGKKIYHADKHIANLEGEQADLRQELTKRTTMEEVLAKIEATNRQPSNQNQQKPEEQNDNKNSISEVDIEKKVAELLSKEQQKSRAERNLAQAEDDLKKAWGFSYKQKLQEKAMELDVSLDFLKDVAIANPKAFIRMLGTGEQTSRDIFDAPPKSSHMTFTSKKFSHKVNSDFNKIYKTDPNLYWSPKIQNEMHALAMKHGDDFTNN